MTRRNTAVLLLSALCAAPVFAEPASEAVFRDNFAAMPAGIIMGVVGAEAEYHYLPACAPVAGWSVSAYRSDPGSQRAWRMVDDGDRRVAGMFHHNKFKDMHPILSAGSPLWDDYTLRVRFAPDTEKGWCGVIFRSRNDRCYHFFGVDGQRLALLRVNQGKAFRELNVDTLAEAPFSWKPGQWLDAVVQTEGGQLRAEAGGVVLEARDAAFGAGGIGLLSDNPARFASVEVLMTPAARARWEAAEEKRAGEEAALQAANPKPVVWRKISTDGFGVGRNLRFGDLDGDGRMDILIGQVVHHGPKDTNSEVSCLTALDLDGKQLWQTGIPDPWKYALTNDVAFQIHDLDGDGRSEVVYCMNQEIVVAEGATGRVLRRAPTPESPRDSKKGYNRFPRILGDALFFCDTRGLGRMGDIVLKDRYQHFWVMDGELNPLWEGACNTGHYPHAADVDGDGRDEIVMGYSLYDHDGKVLWTLDGTLQDHADGVAVVKLGGEDGPPVIVTAGSDEGMLLIDTRGKILRHLFLGHVQNPGTADFRPDLPGLETATVNFWGNQGIIHFYDAEGNVYGEFEPFQHGSLCLPVNWTGAPGEFVMLSANPEDGGLLDGWGRRVVRLPADGHPDMCYAVLDVTGDCRDELVVWDPQEIWIYTQDDNPKTGRLYKPLRNPLCNHSNYQSTVSLPGWNEPEK